MDYIQNPKVMLLSFRYYSNRQIQNIRQNYTSAVCILLIDIDYNFAQIADDEPVTSETMVAEHLMRLSARTVNSITIKWKYCTTFVNPSLLFYPKWLVSCLLEVSSEDSDWFISLNNMPCPSCKTLVNQISKQKCILLETLLHLYIISGGCQCEY